ncbi:MAG: sugar phosphate nucleotidyltransferase [Vicinamibacterales bacterium]
MRALILTAGLGTRLRPLTDVRAKAAVPVNGEPIVRRVIAWLVRQQINDLVLNLHHRPASIAAIVGDGRDIGARVRYSWENPVLGSGGGPRHALPLLVGDDPEPRADSPFLIVNGDTLTDLRLTDMIDAHRSSGALVTMALTRNPRPDLYGGVIVRDGWVTGFSRRGTVRESFHFIGVQVAEERAYAQLEDGVPAESVAGLYPQLISADPAAVCAHVVEAPFSDVGTPAEYLQTSVNLAAVEGDHLISSVGTEIHPSAEVRRTAVWDHVAIGAHSRLEDCIVCDGVRIPEGSRYQRCAIVPHRGDALRDGERVEGGVVVRGF